MTSLKFERVDNQEKLDRWRKFADSFDHGCENPITPIVTISERDEMFAHYHLIQPVILPAFHPEKTSPRRFVEAINAVSNAACLGSLGRQFPNGVAYAALPSGDKRILDDSLISKVGFLSLDKGLYWRLG